MKNHPLMGRWDIVAWEQAYDDGRRVYPMGEDLEGFIRYQADGDMMCMIARADRPAFTTGGQWDASAEEQAGAYLSMLAYAGTYEVNEDTVVHHVEISLFPNWVGGDQKRQFVMRGDDEVSLEARLEEGTPNARTARLVWRRHGS